MIAIQKTNTKKHGSAVEVRLTGQDAFASSPLNRFRNGKSASKFVSSVNRKQKMFGKTHFIANAIIRKSTKKQTEMDCLIDQLKERFNNG